MYLTSTKRKKSCNYLFKNCNDSILHINVISYIHCLNTYQAPYTLNITLGSDSIYNSSVYG